LRRKSQNGYLDNAVELTTEKHNYESKRNNIIMKERSQILIGNKKISLTSPTYFIADIASNHDGSIERAKKLIWDAKNAGVDAVKFQHFLAEEIVSDYGFKELGGQFGHQSQWKDSVFDTYKKCECKRNWTEELYKTAKEAGIDFLTTPYDFQAVDLFDSMIPAYKIGSGDITWLELLEHVAKKGKPVIISTGASTLQDVKNAVAVVEKYTNKIIILQCNTNYTGLLSNYYHLNLNVIRTYKSLFPDYEVGLSDHTPDYTAVLGAVALGARVIEKHFTDDRTRMGPDHPFSMDPNAWSEMIAETRKLEHALGNGIKIIEENEIDTVILQRRCLRLNSDKKIGEPLFKEDINILRPAPLDSIPPSKITEYVGRKFKIEVKKNSYLTEEMFEYD